MLDGDVADQLHQGHGLAHPRAPEQPDLATLGDWHDEVDDLDPGFQDFDARSLFRECRRLAVDGHALVGADRAGLIHRLAQHVHDAAQRRLADRYGNRVARVDHLHAAPRIVSAAECNGTYHAVAQLLLDFQRQLRGLHFQRFEDPRHGVT
jgi:peptide chain release factor 1